MKKLLNTAGLVILILVVYSLLQGLFTGLAIGGYTIYNIATGALNPDITNITAILKNPVVEKFSVDAMSIGLFLSSASMLLFMHVTKLYRLRKSLFTSIAFKPLLLSTALVLTSMFAMNIFVQWFPLENLLANEFDGMSHNLFGAFTISILAPLLEEVMFRGAIQGRLMRNVRTPWTAIIAAALVFGVFHMNPIQIVYATMLGVVFGWIYYRTGSLMSVIVGHVLNNSVATVVTLLIGSENEIALLEENMSSKAAIASEIFTFLIFTALSLYIAIKLHRSLPAAPSPWHESDEVVEQPINIVLEE